MTDCKTSGSPCALSARQTLQRAAKPSKLCLQTHTLFIKTLRVVLFYLQCSLLSKATIMQTLGHLLNSSVTNYSITFNGLISKGSFLPREWRLPRLHAESRDRLPGGGREGERHWEYLRSHRSSTSSFGSSIQFCQLKKN